MKKVLAIMLVGMFMVSAGLPLLTHAVTPGGLPTDITGGDISADYTSVGGLVDLLIKVIKWIYTAVLALAVLFILISAFYFITSKGDPKKTQSAKDMLKYAIIGIAVALISFGIVTVIQRFVTSSGSVVG